jgi:DNA-binding SARP family transcriptional activator/tetratricopeptide (TPR) repeat protein
VTPSRLITLGGFAFNVNGQWTRGPATRKARALMAYLIMNRDVDVSREALLDTFWADTDPEHARASLKTALWSIRRCLTNTGADPDDFMLASKSIVRWKADTSDDASAFSTLAKSDDAAACREALQLYRGDFLEGDYDNWTIAERERLTALYETLLGKFARDAKDADAAQRFVARNPYDEDMYVTLIETELAAGRRASAASWVERCRTALAEIGETASARFETRFGKIVHVDLPPAAGVLLPFAGRERELAFIAGRFSDAANGRGSVTVIHGEAGIGKSSLLQRATGIATDYGLRLLMVRCTADIPSSFGPWKDLFISLTSEDFDAFVESHAANAVTAVASAIARLNEPTAIIVDDAHQLTTEALDIFAALARIASAGQAVIAAVRPEGVARIRSRLCEIAFEEIAIAPLDPRSLEWALAHALAGEQPDVFQVLYKRSGGHPLFFAGLLNSLVTAGVLARKRDSWQVTKAIDPDLELPDSVKRFIEIRLQARGDVPRAVACALALEPTANADDLVSVLGMDESTVFDALDDLLSLGLIVQPEERSPFAFSHDLIREVAAAGLNAGRRAALHRAYAERLSLSRRLEASLRRAHHLCFTGDLFSAAECYLKSAQEALDANAPQDAIERCDAGIAAAEKLERTTSRDVLAPLHTTAARASIAAGNAVEAVVRAREALTLVRPDGDAHALAEAMLTLAAMEGAAYHASEQRADAAETFELAKTCGDHAIQSQALVQQGIAARELALRDEALRACVTGRAIALEHGLSEIAQAALEELMRVQITWWLFSDARGSARVGLEAAKRVDPMMEAAFLQVRSALWYLLERFDDARSDLEAALRIHQRPALQFGCYYMAAKIALAQKMCDDALAAVERAAALTNVAKLPRQSHALTLLRIDVLLQRNVSGDNERAHEFVAALGPQPTPPGLLGWSDCIELAHARDAVRMRSPDAGASLRRALNTLEENAHRALLDSDRAFANLAEVAAEINETVLSTRARARSRYYRSMRMVAAGADWGGGVLEVR